MLEVRFRRDEHGRLSSVRATGHAETRPHGEDVVCAAISAVLQAAWAGLAEVARVDVRGRREPGDFEMRWAAAVRERADVAAIVATAECAVAQIALQEPHAVRYVREPEP